MTFKDFFRGLSLVALMLDFIAAMLLLCRHDTETEKLASFVIYVLSAVGTIILWEFVNRWSPP